MITSTTTLLDAVNNVLLDVGERRVTSLTTPFAQKAAKYVLEAVREIQRYNDWNWLYDTVTPTSWVGDQATLTNVHRILHASWDIGTNSTYKRLRYLDPETYDATVVPTPFDWSVSSSSAPGVWTLIKRNMLRVNPYPTDQIGKTKLKVYVIREMVPPAEPGDKFPIPEDMMSLVNMYATSKMCLHHLGDAQTAAILKDQFNEQVFLARAREAKAPVGGQTVNMYRRNRRY